MALTVSIAVALAPAQAARPARAALPTAVDQVDGFGALLSRTADRPSATAGGARPGGQGDSDVDEAPQLDESTDITAGPVSIEPGSWFVPPAVQPETPESAEPAIVDVIALVDDGADKGNDVEESKVVETGADLSVPAALSTTVADEPARPVGVVPVPVVFVSVPALEQPLSDVADAAASATAAAPKRDVAVPAPAGMMTEGQSSALKTPEGRSQAIEARDVASSAMSTPEEPSPVTDAPRGKAGRTATAEAAAPRSEARATAQGIVAEALANVRSAVPVTARADQNRVATTPLLAGLTPQAQADSNSLLTKIRVAQASVDVLPGETVEAMTPTVGQAQTGGREAGQQQSQDQGRSAGRTFGLANAAGLPASMIFPGQATFTAAMERALPLAQALPPSFFTPELGTVVPQIVRSLQMQVTAGGGDMKLTLTPEHLGTVTIELRVEQQRVTATLGADTPAVRGWIAAHEQDLKAGLADLGLQLDELVVRDDDTREREEHDGGRPAPKRGRRVKSEDSVFEIEA